MKSAFVRIFTVLLLVVLPMGILSGCGGDGDAPEDTAEQIQEAVQVEFVRDGVSDYSLIIASKAPESAFSALYKLNRAVGGKLKITAEFADPTVHEIIFGVTSRPESETVQAKLAELHTDDMFRFVIAEVGGKLVILSETEEGYTYAGDYIVETYITGKSLSVPEGCFDVQAISWADHNAKLEETARRKEEERLAKLAAEMEEIKKQIGVFTLADFGKITKLTAAYGDPEVKPQAGQHPRVFFTADDLDTIRANMTAEENAAAYAKYLELSEKSVTGKLPKLADTHNVDYNMLGAIEAKAFRYAVTGEESYGYQAILAIKNYMLTLHIPDGTILDYSRPYGQVIYTAGLVYDWCYDLMTAADKEQFTAGVETILGPPMEIGFPPSKQGAVTGHGTEAQLLRDWYTFAIAAYDEYPDIYNFVAGRIYTQFVEASDFYLESGSHWQGSAYGAYRYYFLLFAEALYRGMAGDNAHLFSDKLENPAITFIHYIRPDGQAIRVGDDYQEYGSVYGLGTYHQTAFYASALYDNPILKGFAKTGLNNFSKFSYSNNLLTPVIYLILNDPSLKTEDPKTLSVVIENGSPLGSIIARSAWEEENTPMVYMKIGEAYSANHEHKDAGSFQIFYNGILASDSGSYFWYGTEHDYAYHKQTISSNSLLIYNPNMRDNGKWIYSGGQRINRTSENATLAGWKRTGATEQAKILGMESLTTGTPGADEKYIFSYLAGDLTNAYDEATVSEVSRYMLSAMTDDESCPMVFVTYDRITAKDAAYKKTFLLHTQQEPTVTDDGFAIVTNTKGTNSGKLVVQSCITDTEMTVIGGEGQQYMVNGKNYPNEKETASAVGEFGWGRIEISPAKAAQTDRMVTVMYVTDAKNEAAPVKAVELESDDLVGALIFDCAMLFPKEQGRVEKALSFTVSGDGEIDYYLADIHAGTWSVSVNGKKIGEYKVTREGGVLSFAAEAGNITVTPVALSEPEITEKAENTENTEETPVGAVSVSFDMETATPNMTNAKKVDGALLWTNPAGETAGSQFYYTDTFTGEAVTVSLDLSVPAGSEALDCILRLRPVERNKIDTTVLSIQDGVVTIPGASAPVMTLSEKMQTLTLVIENDNAGLKTGKNAGTGVQTTGAAYQSNLSVTAYVDGKAVAASKISTYLVFGDGYTYYDGSAAFNNRMVTAQFYSGSGNAGSGSLLVDNLSLKDGNWMLKAIP